MAEQEIINLGIVGIKNCGEYNSQTQYEKLNVVTYQGSSYCALRNTNGNIPTDTNYWQLYAEKGEQGEQGEQGDKPVKGIDYFTTSDKEEIENDLSATIHTEISEQLGDLVSATPLAVSSVSDMTDTSRIYVNTSDGNWYWYDGANWQIGGVYQATGNSDDYSYQISLNSFGTLNENKYVVYSTGALSSLDNNIASDYIELTGYSKIEINGIQNRNSADARGLAYYDKNKTYISGYQYPAHTTIISDYAPVNARYVRFTYHNSNTPTVNIIHKNEEFIKVVFNPNILDATSINISDYLNTHKYSGAYINSTNGAISYYTSQSLQFTEYYPIDQDIVLKLENLVTSSDVRGVAFYDSNLNYISGHKYDNTTLSLIPPSTAKYFSLTLSNSMTPTISLVGSLENILNNNNKLNTTPTINPTKYKGSSAKTFNKLLAIGDSLTAGVFNHNEGGTTEYIEIQKYSYPTQLNKLTNIEVDNMGHGGVTTKQWYDRYANAITPGHDFCIINLGANDTQANNVTTTEVNTNLTNIINSVKSTNPKIKIFIADLLPCYFYRNVSWYSSFRSTIKNVADNNSDCYFLDLTLFSSCKDDTVYANGHLTALGYQKEAEELLNYISYIIDKNEDDFKWIQFIGTNYLYTQS